MPELVVLELENGSKLELEMGDYLWARASTRLHKAIPAVLATIGGFLIGSILPRLLPFLPRIAAGTIGALLGRWMAQNPQLMREIMQGIISPLVGRGTNILKPLLAVLPAAVIAGFMTRLGLPRGRMKEEDINTLVATLLRDENARREFINYIRNLPLNIQVDPNAVQQVFSSAGINLRDIIDRLASLASGGVTPGATATIPTTLRKSDLEDIDLVLFLSIMTPRKVYLKSLRGVRRGGRSASGI